MSTPGAKIVALLDALKREKFDTMPEDERRHLATLLRFVANKADPDVSAAAPADGERAQ